MPLIKPYFRIIRPSVSLQNYLNSDYVFDERYSKDRYQLFTSYKTIERDLEILFEYIEPSDINFRAFSHRTFELLLRICTEIETNCKQILKANGYTSTKTENYWNIDDYKKIDSATKLSSYEITFRHFDNGEYKIKPFLFWKTGLTPNWYKDYNNAKHDRYGNFQAASFENVIHAMAGLLALLFSQFFVYFHPENESSFSSHGDGFPTPNGMFIITPPSVREWKPEELYDFEWDKLSSSATPFKKFKF